MPSYGYQTRKPEQSYCASIRHTDGSSQWTHVRTNLGRKTAFAMIARHFEGSKIEDFRDEAQMTSYDRDQAQQDDGMLRKNLWAGYGE